MKLILTPGYMIESGQARSGLGAWVIERSVFLRSGLGLPVSVSEHDMAQVLAGEELRDANL